VQTGDRGRMRDGRTTGMGRGADARMSWPAPVGAMVWCGNRHRPGRAGLRLADVCEALTITRGWGNAPNRRWSWPQCCASVGFAIGAYLGWRLTSSNLKLQLNQAYGHMALGALFLGLCSSVPGYIVGWLVSSRIPRRHAG